ncbi:MAG: leucine-rich repeat protein [Blautia hansenii]
MEECRKEGALASSLPSYAYSPWKAGRSKEEQREFTEIEEIEIPQGIEILGKYTFYGCRSLKTLKLFDDVKEIGGGSFTGCSSLRNLVMFLKEDGISCIKDVVSETFHEMYVSIVFLNTDERAELIFPEYYEEGVENTPARILETHFHGCGYKYRQCFTDKKVDYKRYDSLFSTALVYEKEEILIPMAVGRLLYPYQLSQEAGKNYENYVRKNLEKCARFYLDSPDWHEVYDYFSRENFWSREVLEKMTEEASRKKAVDIVGYLMDKKRKKFAGKEKKFEL